MNTEKYAVGNILARALLLGALAGIALVAVAASPTGAPQPPPVPGQHQVAHKFGSAAAQAHPGDPVYSLRALPGDRLPPVGMLDDNMRLTQFYPGTPTGLSTGMTAQTTAPGGNYQVRTPHSNVPAPPLEIALEGARAALAECSTRQRRGGVAVVDSIGEIRLGLTADGEDGSHIFVAVRKTLTALEFGKDSAQARADIAADPRLIARVTPAMFVNFGAFPITSGGQIIGAIGYSGGDDVNCARAGWNVIQSRLPQQPAP